MTPAPGSLGGDGIPAGNRPRRVCVVGAGPAGLTVAWELERRGHRATVLERAQTVGGKAASAWIEGYPYDLGAHICNGTYRRLRALAAALGCEFERMTPLKTFDLRGPGVVPNRELFLFRREGLLRYQEVKHHLFPDIELPGLHHAASALSDPTAQWLEAQDLGVLAELQAAYTASGFGYLRGSALPALYLVTFAELSGLFSWPLKADLLRRWTIAGGYMNLWQRLTARLSDVRCGVQIAAIRRDGDGVRVRTPAGEETFDDLVLAAPLEQTLAFLDAGAEERRLFGQIRYLDYYTSVCTVRGLPRDGFYAVRPHVDDPATVGHCVAFHHRYPGSDVYLFYSCGGPSMDEGDIRRLLEADVARMGGQIEARHLVRRWRYFPHVTAADAAAGFYQRLEALQGQRHTYFAGSALAFESVECVVGQAEDLALRFFPPAPG